MTVERRPSGGSIAGIDGCRLGWVVATIPGDVMGPVDATIELVEHIGIVIDRLGRRGPDDIALAGIDIPIGLLDRGRRACDVEARARLGPRRSSVFPTPVRAALDAPDYPTALARSRAVDDGRGLSKQAYFLLPKIAEVDAAIEPTIQDRLIECHPESCFAALAGAPLDSTKRSAEGRAQRTALLANAIGNVDALLVDRPKGAEPDDVLDALVVALTMRAHRAGRTIVVGDHPPATDERGLLMRTIVGMTPDAAAEVMSD